MVVNLMTRVSYCRKVSLKKINVNGILENKQIGKLLEK